MSNDPVFFVKIKHRSKTDKKPIGFQYASNLEILSEKNENKKQPTSEKDVASVPSEVSVNFKELSD